MVRMFQTIKFDDVDTYFAWRHDNTNVKLGTTVLVAPEQIAFWVSNGRLVSVLGPGKHKIDGNYVQGLSWVTSRFTGGEVPSSGELWFISTGQRNLRWGTVDAIPVFVSYANAFREMVELRAHGNIQVALGRDAERIWWFINHLKGTYGDGRCVLSSELARFIRENIMDDLNASLAELVGAIDYGNHVPQLPAVGNHIRSQHISPLLDQYGLQVTKFQVSALKANDAFLRKRQAFWDKLTAAEVDKFEKMREAEAQRYGIEQTGYGQAASRRAQGYTFQEERKFDVLQEGAQNAGVGGDFTSASVGMAMGARMGGFMGGMFTDMAEDAANPPAGNSPQDPPPPRTTMFMAGDLSEGAAPPGQGPPPTPGTKETGESSTKFCIHCGTRLPGHARFCSECGGQQ